MPPERIERARQRPRPGRETPMRRDRWRTAHPARLEPVTRASKLTRTKRVLSPRRRDQPILTPAANAEAEAERSIKRGEEIVPLRRLANRAEGSLRRYLAGRPLELQEETAASGRRRAKPSLRKTLRYASGRAGRRR